MAFAGILTQVLPRCVYETDADGAIINGTYTQIEDKLPIWKIFALEGIASVALMLVAVTINYT